MSRTIESVNKEVAAKLGLPLKLVAECNDYHWKYIRHKLSHPEHSAVGIKWIGTFYTKPDRMIKRLFYYIFLLKKARAGVVSPFRAHLAEAEAKEGISRLWKLKNLKGWMAKKPKKVVKTE